MCILPSLCFYCRDYVMSNDKERLKCTHCKIKMHHDCYEANAKFILLSDEEKKQTETVSYVKCPNCNQLGTIVVKIII